jgi:hypothetical protein
VTRSHVENGAVTGDNVRTINHAAAIFVSIGRDEVQQNGRQRAAGGCDGNDRKSSQSMEDIARRRRRLCRNHL